MKNVAMVNWDKDSKMATITYDSKKTNGQEVLKRIANAGYDSESFMHRMMFMPNFHLVASIKEIKQQQWRAMGTIILL
ncbi:heavy-metal-associated domain-containing protein [Chryseobacterium indoltheticum]|uniref:heavy-metal-associated domain-containing protein n=1 Tax=Chryseobacterium indoltheticum TaxID=254 RepID=UPI003F49225D